jgi:hypothetical protein
LAFSFLVCTDDPADIFVVLRKLNDSAVLDAFNRTGVGLTDAYAVVNAAKLDGLFWLDHHCTEGEAQCIEAFLASLAASFRLQDEW